MPALRHTAFVTLALTLISPAAHADIGVPMIAVFLPPIWLAFIPIVLVEALLLARLLDVSFGRAVTPAFLSNLASTLVGIPLMWFILAVAELICCGEARGLTTFSAKLYAVTVQAPWLIPYEKDLRWMVPCALAVLAIPCFVASVIVEAPVNQYFLRGAERRSLWRATAIANACSYVLLALLIWPAWKLANHLPGFFEPIGEWIVEITFKVAGALTGRH
jgi:hypothetical protein